MHVYRDLRPYICTFDSCPNAEKLYVTRHDWLYHEEQLHQRRWICPLKCRTDFASSDMLRQHLQQRHSSSYSAAQVPVLLDMCERPADPDQVASCALCGEEMILRNRRIHTASHLEDLALFVLPLEVDDNDTEAQSDHAQGAIRNDTRLDDADFGSLDDLADDDALLCCSECEQRWFREDRGLQCPMCHSDSAKEVSSDDHIACSLRGFTFVKDRDTEKSCNRSIRWMER